MIKKDHNVSPSSLCCLALPSALFSSARPLAYPCGAAEHLLFGEKALPADGPPTAFQRAQWILVVAGLKFDFAMLRLIIPLMRPPKGPRGAPLPFSESARDECLPLTTCPSCTSLPPEDVPLSCLRGSGSRLQRCGSDPPRSSSLFPPSPSPSISLSDPC